MSSHASVRNAPVDSGLDPISIEVQWARLISIMDEVDIAVIRSSFSTIVGESRDFAVVMLDRHGRSIAQSQLSSPAFTVTLPMTTRALLERFPVDSLAPGDVLITNDPWLGSGHLPDVNIVCPVFHGSKVAAFIGCVAHVSDIGGRQDFFQARDVHEEGLLIPPSKLCIGGEENDQLVRIVEANVRVPNMVLGDIRALVGAGSIGAARLHEFFDDHGGPDRFQMLAEEILNRSESAMRAALLAMPDGEWAYELDCDGYQESVHLAARVTKQADAIEVDFSGSSDEFAATSINCPFNMTVSDTYYPLKCSLVPHIPNNDGIMRPLRVHAPAGSVLNTSRPRPVKSRSKTSFHIHMAVYGALVQAIPDRVQAGSGSFWLINLYGHQPDDGTPFNVHILPNGGKGATAEADGLATIAFPYNGTVTPTEIVENQAPVRIEFKRLAVDSGGAGERRGGLGQEIALRVVADDVLNVSLRPDKIRNPAPGLLGGAAGAPGEVLLNGMTIPDEPRVLDKDDLLVLKLPGGGGFGAPSARCRNAVLADVLDGYVSPEAALADYGIAVDPDTGTARRCTTSKEKNR